MAQSKPWEWKRVDGKGMVTEWSLLGPTKVLCRFWHDEPPGQEALLIAAAQDLLAALQVCKDALCDHLQYDNGESLERDGFNAASAAIAKATKEI